ncbi:hypothetical protein TIFTF001_020306 [Ficus carica]|uniref:Uncharacterized protein n=1 Tax=Ficus carica TaxID=3494 RepID=A0AA88ATW3_FICCA|nr:hypothetical protein TIFTF001_020306 [Ficus carica]
MTRKVNGSNSGHPKLTRKKTGRVRVGPVSAASSSLCLLRFCPLPPLQPSTIVPHGHALTSQLLQASETNLPVGTSESALPNLPLALCSLPSALALCLTRSRPHLLQASDLPLHLPLRIGTSDSESAIITASPQFP